MVIGRWFLPHAFYSTTRFNNTTGETVKKVILHANKHRYGKYGQSELAWPVGEDIIALKNLIN